ncbi:ABC transporter permease [Paenarthrobacter aromaticivorans]|uniref:ABC transporter permease n=1 Tax=Paenarthrobacter aromaticivorans TaxID=2849150 RepID=A0ABS6I3L9_9MICC|nr:ABC transporter permease [Paenarthrobacter sp. MMS21-TAE1-1]MBU8865644.1 ABC transporter permease [Paenarthrobacter sp. MMS21-TAE1-1]
MLLSEEVEARKDPKALDRARRSPVNLAERYGLGGLLVLMILVFGLVAPTSRLFFSAPNIQNILANQSVAGLIALAMVITLVAGYFDISVAAIAGISSVTMASLLASNQVPLWMAILVSVFFALVAGVINAALITALDLDPFIVTLGTYVLINGILLAFTGGRVVQGVAAEIGTWGAGQWLGIARPFWLLLLAAAIVWYLLNQTPFGRRLAAIGSNRSAAGLAGIGVKRHVFIAYMLGALVAGFAGVLLTVRSGSADAASAPSFLFPALAAVFLGQTTIKPGYPNVVGTMIGVFFVAIAVNGFTLLGAQNWITQVFNGGVLVLAVVFSKVMVRVRDRNAKKRNGAST